MRRYIYGVKLNTHGDPKNHIRVEVGFKNLGFLGFKNPFKSTKKKPQVKSLNFIFPLV